VFGDLGSELVLGYYIISYTIIIHILLLYIYILSYTILSYSSSDLYSPLSLLSFSFSSPLPIYLLSLLFHHLNPSPHPKYTIPIFKVYLSVLTYTYLYSFRIFISHPPSQSTIRPRTNYRRDVSSGVVLFVC